MAQPRTPVPPHRKGEALVTGLARDVENLKRAGTKAFQPDDLGRFRIGDVNFLFADNPDGSITVQLQNARTAGPALQLGVLT